MHNRTVYRCATTRRDTLKTTTREKIAGPLNYGVIKCPKNGEKNCRFGVSRIFVMSPAYLHYLYRCIIGSSQWHAEKVSHINEHESIRSVSFSRRMVVLLIDSIHLLSKIKYSVEFLCDNKEKFK